MLAARIEDVEEFIRISDAFSNLTNLAVPQVTGSDAFTSLARRIDFDEPRADAFMRRLMGILPLFGAFVSSYFRRAVSEHGVLSGSSMAEARLLRLPAHAIVRAAAMYNRLQTRESRYAFLQLLVDPQLTLPTEILDRSLRDMHPIAGDVENFDQLIVAFRDDVARGEYHFYQELYMHQAITANPFIAVRPSTESNRGFSFDLGEGAALDAQVLFQAQVREEDLSSFRAQVQALRDQARESGEALFVVFGAPDQVLPQALDVLSDSRIPFFISRDMGQLSRQDIREARDWYEGSREDIPSVSARVWRQSLLDQVDQYFRDPDFIETLNTNLRRALSLQNRSALLHANYRVLGQWLAEVTRSWPLEALRETLGARDALALFLNHNTPAHVTEALQVAPNLMDWHLDSRDLHPSIVGGPYDPNQLEPEKIAIAGQVFEDFISPEVLYELARTQLSRSWSDHLDVVANGAHITDRENPGKEITPETLRVLIGQTEFARQQTAREFLRDHVFPSFDREGPIHVLDVGPGYEAPFGLGGRYYTFEPYELASMDARIQVRVWDAAPEPLEAVRTFDDRMIVLAPWAWREVGYTPQTRFVSEILERKAGPDWREFLAYRERYLQDFLERTGGRIVGYGLHQEAPTVEVAFPHGAFTRVQAADRAMDATIESFEGPIDVAYFKLHWWLDAGTGREGLGLAALVRLAHRLNPGGFIVTDPFTDESQSSEIQYAHSPHPAILAVLGLEVVADFRGLEYGDNQIIVIRKNGESNELLRRMAERFDATLTQARADAAAGVPVEDFARRQPQVNLIDFDRDIPKEGPLAPREGSLSSESPYRFPRDVSPSATNVAAAREDWLEMLDEHLLHAETMRARNMGDDQRRAEAVARLGLGNWLAGHTLTAFSNSTLIYLQLLPLLQELASQPGATTRWRAGCFGAGFLDLDDEGHLTSRLLKPLARQLGLPLQGLTFEPYEMLVMLLSGIPEARLNVFDVEASVVNTLRDPNGTVMIPHFDGLRGRPYRGGNQWFLDNFLRLAEGDRKSFSTPDGYEVSVIKLPEHHLRKLRVRQTNIGSELIPQTDPLHLSFYMQVAYFMDPVLQRATFIKIIDRTAPNGLIVSDYLLTDAEARLLGLNVIRKIDVYPGDPLEGFTENKDRNAYFYQKQGASNAFVREMMARITRVQTRRVPRPPSGGNGGPRPKPPVVQAQPQTRPQPIRVAHRAPIAPVRPAASIVDDVVVDDTVMDEGFEDFALLEGADVLCDPTFMSSAMSPMNTSMPLIV